MRASRGLFLVTAFIALTLVCTVCAQTDTEKTYFAIELEGDLCGYSEIELAPIEENGRELILLKHYLTTTLQALGAEVHSEVRLTYHINPETGQFTYHDSEIKQGQMELWSRVYIEGDTARCEYSLEGDKAVDLPPDVLLENTLIYAHLIRDLAGAGLAEKTYEAFDVREGEVQKVTYTAAGSEDMTLAGQRYSALTFDVSVEEVGLRFKIWIDAETGYLLRSEVGEKRVSYRTDASVREHVRPADADGLIFADVDVLIPDVHSISYMKVRAKMQPSGLRLAPEDLNVPGQKFTGTVDDNLIDGIFEIEHRHYDGDGAPPFPPDSSADPDLAEYLEADAFIEPDDPVLIEKANQLTKGSQDSWEAATRLSEWVGENIGYAIPGGGSARKTYDIRAGECGAHSFLLASFSRAVGIPARVVWGCFYVSNRGGAFGQHAWNEIYMGDAGWIPVDATALETRFVDSGHIRFGIYQSLTTAFNPIEMEILDYRVGSGEAAGPRSGSGMDYEPYLGNYRGPRGREARVFVQDGTLTVEIVGSVTLPFDAPNRDGMWYCKLSNMLFLDFEQDDGVVTAMDIHELVMMPRQSDPGELEEDTPEELRPYLGGYLFTQAGAEFVVMYKDGSLAVRDPLEEETVRLRPPDEKGRWVDEFDKNTITFEVDADGKVIVMHLDVPNRFVRQ
jgi:transglutaminase-like putative cysteine protease